MKKRSTINLEVLPLEEIKRKVNSFKKGSMHTLTIIDGVPLDLEDGKVLYITETFKVRFNIKYHNIAAVRFKDKVLAAENAGQVFEARRFYDELKHKETVAKTALEELEKKEKLVRAGKPVTAEIISKEDDADRHADCPSVVNSKNGHINLTCYTAFTTRIKSVKGGFEYEEIGPQIRYFVKYPDGYIIEVDPEKDKKIKEALTTARTAARALMKKKSGGATVVFKPRVNGIIELY